MEINYSISNLLTIFVFPYKMGLFLSLGEFMKKTLSLLLLMGCVSTSYAQDIRSTLDSDLVPTSIEISRDIQDGLNQTLSGLSSINTNLNEGDIVGAPDYKPAYYNLQKNIESSLLKFTHEMDNLHLKIKKDLKRIKIIESTTFNSKFLNNQSQEEIQKTYEQMGKYIQKDYQTSIKNLYTLNGYLVHLPVKNIRNGFIDIFKEKIKHSGSSLRQMCSTSVCLSKITQDISEWIRIADSINNDISITPKTKLTFTNKADQTTSINHFSVAINDFTKSLIKVGLKPNQTYTTSEAAATYLEQVGTSGVGIGVAIATFPAKLINSAFREIKKIDLTKKFLMKDLTLKKLETYDVEAAIEDFQMTAMTLDTKMIYTIGEEEYKSELITSLKKHASAAKYIIEKVLPTDLDLEKNIKKYYPVYLDLPISQIDLDSGNLVGIYKASNCKTCKVEISSKGYAKMFDWGSIGTIYKSKMFVSIDDDLNIGECSYIKLMNGKYIEKEKKASCPDDLTKIK